MPAVPSTSPLGAPRGATEESAAPATTQLGPLLVVRHVLSPGRHSHTGGWDEAANSISFVFLRDGTVTWNAPEPQRRCGAGDLLILDGIRGWSFTAETATRQISLVCPRPFLTPVLPACVPSGARTGTPAWHAVRELLLSILTPDAYGPGPAAELAALAVRDLLVAASTPTTDPAAAIRGRRDSTLLDRLTRHIDAHLVGDLDAAVLCDELGCSRSTLYRAAAPAGGIAELIARRRLAALHRMLRDTDETRPISILAERHGFPDPGHFARRFKRMFGTTPGQVRAQAISASKRDGPAPNWFGQTPLVDDDA